MKIVMAVLFVMFALFNPLIVLAQAEPAPAFDLMSTLVPALGSLLIALLTWVSYYAANLIKAKVSNTYLEGVLIRADDAITTAVKMVAQTYVDSIRRASEDGTLTADEKSIAKAQAVAAAKSYLGPKGLALLGSVLGLTGTAVDDFLGGKIEAAVADAKAGALTPSP